MVVTADTYRSEKYPIMRIASDKLTNAFPDEDEAIEFFLVFRTDKRPPELDRPLQMIYETGFKSKQCV